MRRKLKEEHFLLSMMLIDPCTHSIDGIIQVGGTLERSLHHFHKIFLLGIHLNVVNASRQGGIIQFLRLERTIDDAMRRRLVRR